LPRLFKGERGSEKSSAGEHQGRWEAFLRKEKKKATGARKAPRWGIGRKREMAWVKGGSSIMAATK